MQRPFNNLIKGIDSSVLGKSNGISLVQHTDNLFKELTSIIETNPYIFKKYMDWFSISEEELKKYLEIVISLHDWGKKHPKWQKHCKDYTLINVELRHEFVYLFSILNSLLKNSNPDLDFYKENSSKVYFLISSILAHHNNLNIDKKEKVNKTQQYLTQQENELLGNISFFDFVVQFFNSVDDSGDIWYKQALLRYVLQLCDKRASILEINDVKLPYFKKFDFDSSSFKELRYLQKIAKESQDRVTILRATTGAGKTLASVLWANEQIEKGYADRLIIAMPTQFTSNSLANSVSKYVNDVNVQHGNVKNLYDVYKFKWVRNLQSAVTVCTIDHLLIAMSLNSEEHQHTFFNLTNACLVIDEADFYDNFVQANIVKLLDVLLKYNVRILIMSATLPNSYVDFLNEKLKINAKVLDDLTNKDKVRVDVKNITRSDEFDYDKLLDKKTAIIYCNTIERAINTYNTLIEKNVDKNRIVLYHSAFTQKDKNDKERRIIEMLGEDAWRNNTQDGIVIMTQIGELSINISSDYMLTDMCIFDRLVQRFGRGCRFDFLESMGHKSICEVDVLMVYKKNKEYCAPYGNLVSRKWIENEYYTKTKEYLRLGEYTYSDYLDIINKIYDVIKLDSESIKNANILQSMFTNNAIFNRDIKVDEMDSESDWRTRNILEQTKVFVGFMVDSYYRYDDYKFDFDTNCVSMHKYNFAVLKDGGYISLQTIMVGDTEMSDYCLDSACYNSEFGIYKNTENNFI